MKHKLRVGFVGTSLASYYANEYRQRERAIDGLLRLAETLDFDLIPVAGAIDSIEAAEQAARFMAEQQVDFLLLQTSACSMGEQLPPLARSVPHLGLWGTPDPHSEGDVRLHSFVSLGHFASLAKRTLADEDIPFKWFYGHVETDEFQRRFAVTVRALTAVKNMARAKIGWIGGLVPGFMNMEFDADALKQRLGVSIMPHTLDELVQRAQGMDTATVQATAQAIRGAASAVTVTAEGAFERVTRVYLALQQMAREYGYDSLAVACWPEIQSSYKVVPCMAYSWLGSEDGIASACEGDVLGSVSMLLLNLLNSKPGSSTLLDMAAFDPDNAAMLLWHCGVSPRHFANQDGVRWVDHTTIGRKSDTAFGVAGDLVFAPQEATITYVNANATELLVLDANIVERPSKGFDGTRGWFADFRLNQTPIKPWDLVNTLTVTGHPHHYAVAQGTLSSELLEFAAWKRMQLVQGIPYTDYLQR